MLSHYTWGQFGLFILLLVVLYYMVVGFIYYRDELSSLLTPGKKRMKGQTADAAQPAPPALVRPTSAFRQEENRGPKSITDIPTNEEEPENGAVQNLPTPSEPLVGGKLPNSTATIIGFDNSADATDTVNEAAVDTATHEEQELDAERTEEEDHANEQLAAIIRQRAHEASIDLDCAEVAYEITHEVASEPLADFTEPMASMLDITQVEEEPLVEAESLADYLAQIQAGVKLPVPMALDGTTLEAQLILLTAESAHELTLLFGEEA